MCWQCAVFCKADDVPPVKVGRLMAPFSCVFLRSLGGVFLSTQKLGSKSGGLSSGQNLVLFVTACRLLGLGSTRLFCLTARLSANHLHPLCTPRASSCAHQRLLWCIKGSNSTWREFVCRHGGWQHRHRPKRTKISNISLVQHADLGCSK